MEKITAEQSMRYEMYTSDLLYFMALFPFLIPLSSWILARRVKRKMKRYIRRMAALEQYQRDQDLKKAFR